MSGRGGSSGFIFLLTPPGYPLAAQIEQRSGSNVLQAVTQGP
jgi:hypothetical protein